MQPKVEKDVHHPEPMKDDKLTAETILLSQNYAHESYDHMNSEFIKWAEEKLVPIFDRKYPRNNVGCR